MYVCWTQEEKQISPVWRFLGKNDLARVARVRLFKTAKRCFVAFVTLLKTNECPLKIQWLEDVFPTEMVVFLGDMLVFGSVLFGATLVT